MTLWVWAGVRKMKRKQKARRRKERCGLRALEKVTGAVKTGF